MREEVEKRLHRVAISLEKDKLICPKSKNCEHAKKTKLCNKFFKKCGIFKKHIKERDKIR
jgi:hypothetical protein